MPVPLSDTIDLKQRSDVATDAIIGIVAPQVLIDLRCLFSYRLMSYHAHQMGELANASPKPASFRLTSHHEIALAVLSTVVGESQEMHIPVKLATHSGNKLPLNRSS